MAKNAFFIFFLLLTMSASSSTVMVAANSLHLTFAAPDHKNLNVPTTTMRGMFKSTVSECQHIGESCDADRRICEAYAECICQTVYLPECEPVCITKIDCPNEEQPCDHDGTCKNYKDCVCSSEYDDETTETLDPPVCVPDYDGTAEDESPDMDSKSEG